MTDSEYTKAWHYNVFKQLEQDHPNYITFGIVAGVLNDDGTPKEQEQDSVTTQQDDGHGDSVE